MNPADNPTPVLLVTSLDYDAVFSPQELRVFQLLASGMAVRAIGKKFHRSPKTIFSHAARMAAKLGVDNIDQLRCAAAVRFGRVGTFAAVEMAP